MEIKLENNIIIKTQTPRKILLKVLEISPNTSEATHSLLLCFCWVCGIL